MPNYQTKDNVQSGVPLGGIGAGKIEILPSGLLNAFTLQNNWSKPLLGTKDYPGLLGYHFGVRLADKAFLLQTTPLRKIPLVKNIRYNGVFPRAELQYEKPGIELDLKLEASSSWFPSDVKNSSLPAASFKLTVKNTSAASIDFGFIFIGRNICGKWCVGRQNRIEENSHTLSLEFSNQDPSKRDVRQGSLRFSFLKADWHTSFLESWNAVTKNFSFNPENISLPAWDIFSKGDALPNTKPHATATGENQELCGAVALDSRLGPGQKKILQFTASWYFPYHPLGHRYSEWFRSAKDVAEYVLPRSHEFEKKIKAVQKTVFQLPFPPWFNEALLASLAPFFASNWYVKDGRFAFYEAPSICPLLGTMDVGFYGSIPLSYFFPELEKSQITLFAEAQRADGYIPHDLGKNRLDLPSDGTTFYFWKDLNPKFGLMTYRDFLWSKDKHFLKRLYPHAKRAMQWSLKTDVDGNGLPDNEGADHTFDLWHFYGTSAYTSGIFLASLLACEKMAEAVRDLPFAKTCREQFFKGRYSFEKELWNGRYFGQTCSLSQLNGQWYADLLGLEPIADLPKIQKALTTILKINASFSRYGMVNSVLENGRLDRDNPHSQNIWCGMNYAFVSLCLMNGFPLIKLLKPLRQMWDNSVRVQKNPWNQPDMIDSKTGRYLFGDFYYRNLAIWSIPIAFSKRNRKTAGILHRLKEITLVLVVLLGSTLAQWTSAAENYTASDYLESYQNSVEDSSKEDFEPPAKKEATPLLGGLVTMSGRYRMAAGVGDDFILNDSNPNFNMNTLQGPKADYLYGESLNNTFDPAIYSQVLLNLDLAPTESIRFHTQIVNDPWSLVGTTGEQVQITDPLDPTTTLRYNLKYFGANNSTLGEVVRSHTSDRFNFPIIKVHDGHTTATTVEGFIPDILVPTQNIFVDIPELDIDYEYHPIRKLWMDATHDPWKFRLFALADETQALTTDDPLVLSNHKDYWQPSPWLYEYQPAQFFEDVFLVRSMKRGYYSDNPAFSARDSEGNRLVLLKGASLEADFGQTNLAATVAAPHTPWDDYFSLNNVPGALRVKHQVNDQLMVGSTYTFRLGMVDDSVDDNNQVIALDSKYKVNENTSLLAEVALSGRSKDRVTQRVTFEDIDTHHQGYAYKAAAQSSFDHDLDGHTDLELSYTQMDKNFEPLLSSYLGTRDDKFWGMHLSFDDHPEVEYFRLGDGVDINRFVYRFSWKEKLFKEKFFNLFDVRNVHKTDNTAYLETVLRDEMTYKFSSKLTGKGLFRWRGLPKTTPGVEPSLTTFYFPQGDVDLRDITIGNADVRADQNADQFTYSLGLQYQLDPQWTLEGIAERTNTLPDFPRGLLSDFFKDANDRVDGILIDRVTPFLYSQVALRADPPYAYYNIFKERVIYKPLDQLKLILHATQNGYHFAGGIDDNISHVGLSAAYDYSKKLSFFADYTHSRQVNLPKLIATSLAEEDVQDHDNLYFSFDYRLNTSTVFRTEYGVFGIGTNSPLATPYSVTGFSLPTVDTEHLLRMYLTGEF